MADSFPSAAPWRSTFLSHVKGMSSPIFAFATLHPTKDSSSSNSSASAAGVVPRVRTCVFRGMWADISVNPKNTAELNPDVYQSDMITFTTDARMEKVPELFDTAQPPTGDSSAASRAGGPVEAMFWVEETSTQWRLRGTSYVIGPDIESDAAKSVREAVESRMRGTGQSGEWSWARELTAQFGNLSPGMRGSFRNPPSGRPLSEKPGEGLSLGQKVSELDDEVARSNFRVVVIVPDEVDRVDLTDPAEGKRWNYALDRPDSDTWKVTEEWP